MTFKEESLADFRLIFEHSKEKIKNFKGCSHVELCNDIDEPTVFFTYSHWESEEALNEYRNSPFFQSTWSKTKVLFSEKPEAYSLRNIYTSDSIVVE